MLDISPHIRYKHYQINQLIGPLYSSRLSIIYRAILSFGRHQRIIFAVLFWEHKPQRLVLHFGIGFVTADNIAHKLKKLLSSPKSTRKVDADKTPGLGAEDIFHTPGRGHAHFDPALHHAAAKPDLHRDHPGQEPDRDHRHQEGPGHCGEQRQDQTYAYRWLKHQSCTSLTAVLCIFLGFGNRNRRARNYYSGILEEWCSTIIHCWPFQR